MMSEFSHPLLDLLAKDTRYQAEAYEFIRNALNYAHDELGLGQIDQQVLAAAMEAGGDIPDVMLHISAGFIGMSTTAAFLDFVKNYVSYKKN